MFFLNKKVPKDTGQIKNRSAFNQLNVTKSMKWNLRNTEHGNTLFNEGIKQRRACFYPVSETYCEAKPSFNLCFTSVPLCCSMFLKLDKNTGDAVLFFLENNFQNINN